MFRLLFCLLLLTGCASSPRDNASNVCTFLFLSSLHNPLGLTSALACSFGLELVPDGEEEETPKKKKLLGVK